MTMCSPYALLLALCGLSQREAAEFHGVRPDTVKSWSSGRNNAPAGVLAELAALHARQRRAADEMEDAMERAIAERIAAGDGAPEAIELGLASDDHEAQALGWPCVGAQGIALAMTAAAAIARGIRVEMVPRGSTPATAAAADVHEET